MGVKVVVDGASSHTSDLGNLQTRVVSGDVVLDGSNPTEVDTGLARVMGAMATLKASASPGDDPVSVTVDFSEALAGVLRIYAWKVDGVDPTLVASTNNSAVVSWVAVGLKPADLPRTDDASRPHYQS